VRPGCETITRSNGSVRESLSDVTIRSPLSPPGWSREDLIRLILAAAAGIGLATSVASEETSAPILERLGFETACRVAVYYVDA
jgi:hypothetical protein